MRIFLAGGVSGNLNPLWKIIAQEKEWNEAVRIFLAGTYSRQYVFDGHNDRPVILESFFYANNELERLIPQFGDFLLDSGAFTFMQGKGGKPLIWRGGLISASEQY